MPKRKGRTKRRKKAPKREYVRRINGKEYGRMDIPYYSKNTAVNAANKLHAAGLLAQVYPGKKQGKNVYYVYVHAPGPHVPRKKRGAF